MKSVVYRKYGSPEVLELVDTPRPEPKVNEILIKIHASIVTPGDIAYRNGNPFVARLFSGLFKPKKEVLGSAFAGEVESVGEEVTRFKPGDQVYGSAGTDLGTYAEYIALPEDGAIAFKPANMSFDKAVGVCDGGLTSLPFLRDNGDIRKGQKILINGASGSVGSFAVQLAKHFGAEVTGVCSSGKMEMVRSLGADHVIDYTQEDFTNNSGAYDIIFDTVGKSSFSKCRRALKSNGIFLTTYPSLGILFQMLWTRVFSKKKAIFAATGLRPPGEKVRDLVNLKDLIEAGKIKSIVDRSYSMSQIVEAHRYVAKGHKTGNVVISFKI